jgi:hypothetical protein
MIKNIQGLRPTIKPLHRGFSECRICAFDTETFVKDNHCEINTVQFAGDDLDERLLYIDNTIALPTFMSVIDEWARQETTNVVFGFNLSYDIQALLLGYPQFYDELANGYVHIEWDCGRFEYFQDKIAFGKIHFGKHRRVWLIDAFRYTFEGLDASCKMFGLECGKLTKPKGLGQTRFSKGKSKAFEQYAIQDAVATYELGKIIIQQHKDFDIPICVSIAQFSAKVFRKNFLQTEIVKPSFDCEEMAISSFHGGMQRAIPGFYDNLIEYDISSAYPEAMDHLGVPESYEIISKFETQKAVYQVEGKSICRAYPIIFDNAFRHANSMGMYFVDGFSLESAFLHKEFDGKILRGWKVNFSREDDSLHRFVEFFYREKSLAKEQGNLVKAHFYKRILNSLYGKFIQTLPENGTNKPSGLWNPFLATLITGFVRAKIHSYEHLSNSVHTATDAVKTNRPLDVENSNRLGSMCKEIEGSCIIIRPKVYAHYDHAKDKWKLATHGLGVDSKTAWKQILDAKATSKRRVVSARTARQRHLNLLTWIDVRTELSNEIPAMPQEFERKLKEYVS